MTETPRPVSAIRNLGPRMAEAFARAGIETAEEVEALGTDAAYAHLLAAGDRPHFMAYVALALGLEGRPWNDLRAEEKPVLRARFEAVKAAALEDGALPPSLRDALDRFGIGR
ncbi:MAG: TfoX/Sxy family DNA transformation protein [Pseudomonadota bacterium]